MVYDGDYVEPSMVIDAHGHAHIAARGDTGIWYLTNKSGSWIRTRLTTDHTNHDGNPVRASGPAIAIDISNGAITLAYSVYTYHSGDPYCSGTVTFVTRRPSGWSSPHPVPTSHCDHALSLAVRDGKISVAAMRTSSTFPSQVWFDTNASGAWTTQSLPQPNDENTQLSYPSLALDSHGRPHIAYLRGSFDTSTLLFYARGTSRKGDFVAEKAFGPGTYAAAFRRWHSMATIARGWRSRQGSRPGTAGAIRQAGTGSPSPSGMAMLHSRLTRTHDHTLSRPAT
jgi:hypothetical protein